MSVTTGAVRLSVANKVGLVLAALLGLADVLSVLATPGTDETPGPPAAVMIVGAVLGVITLVAVGYTFRTGNRIGARITCASRILSMLMALPAFFVPDVPAGWVAAAAAAVVLTLVSVFLVLARPRRA